MSETEAQEPAERTFTLEQANELLPWLRDVLPRIREARQIIMAGGERIRRTAPLNGGGEFSKEYWDAMSSLRRDLEDVSRRGIILRDAETGLIDFPSELEGEPILLCWRLGEERVGYWHGQQSGFAGRQPL